MVKALYTELKSQSPIYGPKIGSLTEHQSKDAQIVDVRGRIELSALVKSIINLLFSKSPDRIKVYLIWDTKENKQWVANSSKTFWKDAGHAKSAWMINYNGKRSTGQLKSFSDQDRYICYQCVAIREKAV